MSEKMEAVATSEAPAALGAYSQAVKANGFVFVSGQLGIDPATGELAGETAGEQAAQALKNIKHILDTAGTGIEHVCRATIYLKNVEDFKEVDARYAEVFIGSVKPARVAFGGNGVGQTLKIGANKFRVVGVLSAKVSDPTMQQGSDDDCVYLPYTTVMRLSSQSMVDCYTAMMADESLANEAKTTMEEELMSILKTENGYYVYSASEWLEEMNKMINMVIVILTGIASISLLVGGIGIMNIMLVSVTERTKEIGIRKAMGAKERVILAQFVTEAATTSALGGALGIVLGYIVSMAANRVLPMFTDGMDITVSPSFNSIAAAFGISVFIGVLFGYLPAKRAARLNPIEALRYD